jgi:hypothetical protein
MYLTRVDPEAAENFLNGIGVACFACGLDVPLAIRERATIERGWNWSAARPIDEMRQRGLDEQAIVDELLAIEIVALEKLSREPLPGGVGLSPGGSVS